MMIHDLCELIAHSFYNCSLNRRSFLTKLRLIFLGSLEPSCEDDATPDTEKASRIKKSEFVDCTTASVV
jgi:hypothetical protein